MRVDFWHLSLQASSELDSFAIEVVKPSDNSAFCDIRIQPGHWMEFEPWLSYKGAAVAQIPTPEAEALMQHMRHAHVEAAPPFLIGAIDGVTYTLEVRCGLNRNSFSWFGSLPEQWSALEPVVNQLKTLWRQHVRA